MSENNFYEENGFDGAERKDSSAGSYGDTGDMWIPGGTGSTGQSSSGRDKSRWIPKDPVKKTKKSGKPKKWMSTVAAALVFGLIAGSVTYATDKAAERLIGPVGGTAQASVAMASSEASVERANAEGKVSSTGSTGAAMTVADVAATAMPSMVTVSTMSVQEMRSFFGGRQQYEVEGAGTGIIVGQTDKELLIATNEHVVAGATEVSIGFIDESVVEVTVKGEDPDNDLAVLSARLDDISEETKDQIRVAVIGDSDAVTMGEQVVAIGNALGYGQSVTVGCVSALDRTLEFSDENGTATSEGLIQTDAAINAGNSGGALLNMRGEVIGINEAKSSSSYGEASVDNMGYAIPMAKAVPILEEMMNGTARTEVAEKDRGYLGITFAEVTEEYSQLYGMPAGICITEITEDGPAQKAGLQKGDIITSFDGHSVKTQAVLQKLIAKYKAGETIEVLAQRADNGVYVEQSFTVTLGTAKQAGINQNGTLDSQNDSEDSQEDAESTQPQDPYYGGDGYGGMDEEDIFNYFFGNDPYGGYGQESGPSGSGNF